MSASRRALSSPETPSATPDSSDSVGELKSLNNIINSSSPYDGDSTAVPLLPTPHSARQGDKSCVMIGNDSMALSTQASSYAQATSIIAQDSKAKDFRSRLKIYLAITAVINFVVVIAAFIVAPPPGMGAEAAKEAMHKSGINASIYRGSGFNLAGELDESTHRPVFLAEGGFELIITLTGCFILFLSHISRHAEKYLGCFSWVPRSPGSANSDGSRGWTNGELVELFVWILHCPIGAALWEQRCRYINGFCVIRLYTVIQVGMEFTEFKSQSLRVMANFFSLQLTSAVFVRWALEHHKWKILIPTFFFWWGFLAYCFSLAEGLSWGRAGWFIIVTFTTVGITLPS